MTGNRSIGARSDYGDTDAEDGISTGAPSRTWSIYKDDGDSMEGRPRPEDDPDDPINKYVQEQLARIKSNESHEYSEELAAQNDGANDEKSGTNGTNGHA